MLFKSMIFCLITTVHNIPRSNYNFLNDQLYFADDTPTNLPSLGPSRRLFAPVLPLTRGGDNVEIEKNDEEPVTITYVMELPKPGNGQVQLASGQVSVNGFQQTVSGLGQLPVGQAQQLNGYNNVLYSVTDFGLSLLKNINTEGNLVVSPYSITSLLSLLQQGAQDQTQEQISSALHMSPDNSAAAFGKISNDFKKRNTRNILKTACNVFVADAFTLNPSFKKIAQKNFDSDITSISFSRSEQASKQINSWVASRTNNKIEKLITPESLDDTTQVVLVNAIYFKGLWEVPFRVESTRPREFHLSNGAKKLVPFMSTRRHLKAGKDPATNAQIAILPFEGAQYSLMLILPSLLFGVSGTVAQMTDARLLSYHSFTPMETALQVPKFTVRADTDLIQVLRKMGISNIFGPNSELGGLGSLQAIPPQISSAVHSAVLSIDEAGGSAAAATSFAAVALSNDEPSLFFRANRPFIAVLWDEKTSLPLFMAKIEDPSQ